MRIDLPFLPDELVILDVATGKGIKYTDKSPKRLNPRTFTVAIDSRRCDSLNSKEISRENAEEPLR